MRSFYLLLPQKSGSTLERALLQKNITGVEPVPVVFQYHKSPGKGVTVRNLKNSKGIPPSPAFCVLPLSPLSLLSLAIILSLILLG